MTRTIELSGRTALVTGAASGIGRSCALLLASAGAHVVTADLDDGGAKNVIEEISASGGRAESIHLDVTEWTDCIEAASSRVVDILVNCAATWTIGPFIDTDPTLWRRDLEVTLSGTLNVTRAFLPAMVAQSRGSVVNISSEAGRIGEPNQVVYSAAKAGVIGFTRALAREVGRSGIRVNCVAPGLTRTKGAASFINAIGDEKLARQYPLGRIGEPEDIAEAVLFLVSDQSIWITGQVLPVSGGYTTT